MFAAQRVLRRPHAAGRLRRAIAVLISVAWVASSLVCPVPVLAHGPGSSADHSSGTAAHGHEHHQGPGDNHDNDDSDACCDILGQLDTAVGSLNSPLDHTFAPDYAPLPVDGFKVVVAAAGEDAANLLSHGPAPPRRSWPQFTKVWSQAPPADRC